MDALTILASGVGSAIADGNASDRIITSSNYESTPVIIPLQQAQDRCNNCAPSSNLQMLDRLLVTTPVWESVNQDVRWFFLLHTYTFACLFFVLSFYAFFSYLNLRSLASTSPLMSSINVMLWALGTSRSICLFADPYNYKEIMPKYAIAMLWDFGFPCITSAFCLIQLAFVQLTQLKYSLKRFQKETYLFVVLFFHFGCVILNDLTLAFQVSNATKHISKYVVQTIFLLWGLSIFASFLYTGRKVRLLLKTLPSNLLARDTLGANQKGIMQLAMLAPYSNLATSVAAALVPTLLGPARMRALSSETTALQQQPSKGRDANPSLSSAQKSGPSAAAGSLKRSSPTSEQQFMATSTTVPEVYVRPPTPTPSLANLPIITVSSPSRRSSLVSSRRGSDASKNSRRASECSVRFVNEEDEIAEENKRDPAAEAESKNRAPASMDKPVEGILRRNSECIGLSMNNNNNDNSSKETRRGSDFGQEKGRSQFATKLRRNSDFGNRMPKRPQEPEPSKLAKILDISPASSRRSSDFGALGTIRAVESRRNSDVTCRTTHCSDRRSSEVGPNGVKSGIRRSSDISVRQTDCSDAGEQSADSCDGCATSISEKAALVDDGADEQQQQQQRAAPTNECVEQGKLRKKNLSWKCEKVKEEPQEDITAETSLLSDKRQTIGVGLSGGDFTLHSILNHIAYVNRAKSDAPLQISEASVAAARRAQINRVVDVAYATAVVGIILCVADLARIFGPYGLLAESTSPEVRPTANQSPKPLPWLIYQTVCRLLELIMGCAMASMTKRPSASPRHQYLGNYPNYNFRMKHRDNLYI